MENIKTRKRIFDIILDVFVWLSLFVAVVLAITAFFSTVSGTESGRSFFGHRLFIVNTDSMSKSDISEDEKIFFKSGDLIIIKEISDPSVISVGDVISFVSTNPGNNGQTVSHKVRSVKRDADGVLIGFETYGINTGANDEAIVKPDAVIGRYVGKISRLGSLFNFFKKPAGYFICILTPCLLLIIFFSVKVGKLITKKEMTDIFDIEINGLKDKISEMEREGIPMGIKDSIESAPSDNLKADTGQETKYNTCGESRQMLEYTERVLETTLKTLGNTIETLTSTIEALAGTEKKSVKTLSDAVEALSVAAVSSDALADTKTGADKEATKGIDTQTAGDFDEISHESIQKCEKIPFSQKLFDLDSDIRDYFSDIHNEIVSYKRVKYRISHKGITYRVGRNTVARITAFENALRLYIATGIKDHSNAMVLQKNSSGIKLCKGALLAVDISSVNGKNNAIRIVRYFAKNNGLKKDFRLKNENVFRQIKLFE